MLASVCYDSRAMRLKKRHSTSVGSSSNATNPVFSNAAHKYLSLLSDGQSDESQHEKLSDMLRNTALRGRMLSHWNTELFQDLGRTDIPFVWVFGDDALHKFLGKDLYEICRDLGFDKEWMKKKLGLANPWLFRLVVFEEQQDLDCALNTWQGAVDWISRHYPPQVAQKISLQLHRLAQKGFKIIEAEALGNQTMWDVFTSKNADLKSSYDLEDASCEGNLYQVRQWLYDRGFREEYRGDGLTTGGLKEYICSNKPIANIKSASYMDLGSLDPFSRLILADQEHAEGVGSLESS